MAGVKEVPHRRRTAITNSLIRTTELRGIADKGANGQSRPWVSTPETSMKLVGKSVLIALAAALPLSAALAQQQAAKPGTDEMPACGKLMMEMFVDSDADKNDILTQKELHAYRLGRFKSADANSDGVLSVDELDAMMAKHRAERMQRILGRMDTDGDGKVGADEFARFRGRWARHLDPNGDGNIEKGDMERMAMMRHGGHQFGHRGPHGTGHGPHHGSN
jgi:hypothetical protein